MDDTVLIVPDAIPYPGTSVEILEGAAADMRKAAGEISEGGSGIEASWQGLQAHYTAPESQDLFSAMEPVRTKGETIHDDLTAVAGALETFAEAAASAKERLWRLREDARAFVDRVGDDPEWSGDVELVTENRALIYAVNRAWGDFQEAERDCANSLENVTGSGNNYIAGSMAEPVEPKPGDIVYGIDPADIPEIAYDLTEWEDWKRLNADTWHFLETGNHGWPMDWAVDASMAQWDHFGPGMLWDVGVGAVAATGLWREGRGWATSVDEVVTNFVDHKTETFQGYGAMAGLYGEDGWMNPFDADERSWETMKANAGPVWEEVAHDIVPWREWDDRPAYTVYTGAGNVALTIVALPVRGGMLAARASQIASGAGRLLPDWDMSLASLPDFDLGRRLGDLRTGTATTLANLNGRLQELTSDLALRIDSWGGSPGSPVFAGVPGGGAWPLPTDGPEGATTAEAARRAENAAAGGGLQEIADEYRLRQEPVRPTTDDTSHPDTDGLPADRRDPAPDATDPRESTSWRSGHAAAVDTPHAPDGSAFDQDTGRERNGGQEDTERREPEFLQRSGGIVGSNNPRINLQEGDGFYDANGDLVEVGRRDHTGTYIDDEGNRYVDVPESAQALERYREIRADDGDIDRIAANTGLDRNVVDEIKQHIFFREHADIASPPDGRLRSGRFAPMDHIADLWRKAETGTLDASEANAFRRLVAHEYVEARLMQEGVPYRSRDPKLWHDDYYMPTRHNSGAHDLAPLNWKDDGFALWEKWGVPKPDSDDDFRLADDMSNLDGVAASALAWWRHQNPQGGFPFERRLKGSAPGMAIDADTDPGRSRNTPDPSIYANHPSARPNFLLAPAVKVPTTSSRKPTRFYVPIYDFPVDLNEGAKKIDRSEGLEHKHISPLGGAEEISLCPSPDQRFGDADQLEPRVEYEVHDTNNDYRGTYVTDEDGEIREVRMLAASGKDPHPELSNPRPNSLYVIKTKNSSFTYETNAQGDNLETEGAFTRGSAPRIGDEEKAVRRSAALYYKAYNKILAEEFKVNPGKFSRMVAPPRFESVSWNGGHIVGIAEYGGIPERLNQVAMRDDVNQHAANDWHVKNSYRNFETSLLKLISMDLSSLQGRVEPTILSDWNLAMSQSSLPPDVRVRVSQVYERELPLIKVVTTKDKVMRILGPPPSAIIVNYSINGFVQQKLTYVNLPYLK
ncbi:WXG100 family type VII secretion target [Nocardiopsis dassonvillei]|uniref:WXG100 family type VII secretion target n=1 Tax=Nocardiopsis dassonvillei TaxID=2014 RepID=UPI003F55F3F5